MYSGGQLDVLPDGEKRHHPQLAAGHETHPAVKPDLARVSQQHPGEQLGNGGLAGTGQAEHRNVLAGADGDRKLVDREELAGPKPVDRSGTGAEHVDERVTSALLER